MSADLLQRAAAKLREAAEAATRGPWDNADDGLVWPERMGDPVSGSTEVEDAAYIALMHPPVAEALADALESASKLCDRVDNDVFAELEHVARAILREEAS
jgi:hypothetical protein